MPRDSTASERHDIGERKKGGNCPEIRNLLQPWCWNSGTHAWCCLEEEPSSLQLLEISLLRMLQEMLLLLHVASARNPVHSFCSGLQSYLQTFKLAREFVDGSFLIPSDQGQVHREGNGRVGIRLATSWHKPG